jgi:amino acid transporter
VLIAWSPIVLYESAGTAHRDALLMLFALGGLLMLISPKPGYLRVGLLLIAVSALCKPVTAPLLGSAALVRLAHRREPIKRITWRWFFDVAVVLALVAFAFGPYWGDGRLPGAMFDNQRQLYVEKPLRANPFWIWLLPHLGIHGGWLPVRGAQIAQSFATLFVLIAIFWLVRREVRLRQNPNLPDPTPTVLLRRQIQTWAVVMFALAYIPPNSHSWYMIWALPLMTLILVDRARFGPDHQPVAAHSNGHSPEPAVTSLHIPWPLLVYFSWSFISFFIYHTFTRG